ncbi:FIG00784359: hypothetical protein [hydrothermal vent metagenome]|uniref:Glycosyl transferase family 1 domain-containing protein n=1 Tax=hydrothermal vent metagenome TaxID=652676 RepID=A0A3B0WLZ3_9ZZZZ
MYIGIITPAAPKSLNGNRATAQRWADFLIQLGHRVDISMQWDGTEYDVMLALHAWRSAESIAQFKQAYPQCIIILAMTGTDLYRFIKSHPEPTLASIKYADKLITLHRLAERVIPEQAHHKIHVIHQSALPLCREINRSKENFDICVVGHLREEKDSLRVAYAVRNSPESSRIRILHYGKAHNEEWANYAKAEMKINARYHWLGEVSHEKIREAYATCHLMVLPSIMEGGANVISEATVAGLPVIASDIDGSIGLLGDDYAGYFPVKNEIALGEILLKAEGDITFLEKISLQCNMRAKLFSVNAERQALDELMKAL